MKQRCSCCGDIFYAANTADGECPTCQKAKRDVESLEVKLERVTNKLNELQDKYQGLTGQRFVMPLRLA